LHDDTNVIGANISAPLISRITLHSNSTEIKLSDILQKRSKVELLLSIFDPKGKLSTQDFHDAMTDDILEILPKADLLFAMLKARFQTHIKNKVKLCQQKNMCLSWASKNLALVAVWMIVASHLKEDISCLDESKCLLANPISNKFLVCSNKELSYHGCYLFHNRNKDAWIRSGSATGKGSIGKRLFTHMEQPKCDRNDGDSWFYHFFPSKTSAHSTSTAKEGYYEHLTAYAGVGFLADYPLGCFLKLGGLLIFTEEEEKWISAFNF
jgi:hypothetical protein